MDDIKLNHEQLNVLIGNLQTHLEEHGIEKSSAGCIACKVGLGTAIGSAVAACIVVSDGACIAVIVDATGLSVAAVEIILAGGGAGVAEVLEELCKAMKAC